MNRNCIICNEPATRICAHQNCEQYPFLCSGECLNFQNKAFVIHTHNGENKFMSYHQVSAKINDIKSNISFVGHVNDIEKRLELFIGDIRRSMKRYKQQLLKRQRKTNKKISQIISNFTQVDFNTIVKGKSINYFLTTKSYYEVDDFEQKAIETVKQEMCGIVQKLQNMKMGNFLNLDTVKKHIKQGKALASQHKYAQSIKQYEKAARINPFQQKYKIKVEQCKKWVSAQHYQTWVLPQQHFNLGNSFYLQQNYPKAIQLYNKAIALNKTQSIYYNYRGNSFLALKQFENALQDYNMEIQLGTNDAIAYCNRAQAYVGLKLYDEAIKDYSKAIQTKHQSQLPLTHFDRGNCYFTIQNYAKAIQDFSKAIQLNEFQIAFYEARAWAYYQIHEHQKAIEDYNILLTKFQQHPNYYYMIAYNLYDVKQYKKALSNVNKAIKMNPDQKIFLEFHAKIENTLNCLKTLENRGCFLKDCYPPNTIPFGEH